MKKFLFAIILSIVSFNMIHADVTWKLSEDSTLTISGTNMPDYYSDSEEDSTNPWYSQREKIKKVVIEDGVTTIGSGAFYRCSNLTSVTIPKSVTSIGRYAFWFCSGLTSFTISNSVTSIGDEAFAGCWGLTSVTLGNSVTSIGNSAFEGCSRLTTVIIPKMIIRNSPFRYIICAQT